MHLPPKQIVVAYAVTAHVMILNLIREQAVRFK